MIALAISLAIFSPVNTAFKMYGGIVIDAPGFTNQNCQFEFSGNTTAHDVVINSASLCAGVIAAGLPWTWTAASVKTLTGHATTDLVIVGHACGENTQKLEDRSGEFLFYPVKANGCTIGGGSASTSPNIAIAK